MTIPEVFFGGQPWNQSPNLPVVKLMTITWGKDSPTDVMPRPAKAQFILSDKGGYLPGLDRFISPGKWTEVKYGNETLFAGYISDISYGNSSVRVTAVSWDVILGGHIYYYSSKPELASQRLVNILNKVAPGVRLWNTLQDPSKGVDIKKPGGPYDWLLRECDIDSTARTALEKVAVSIGANMWPVEFKGKYYILPEAVYTREYRSNGLVDSYKVNFDGAIVPQITYGRTLETRPAAIDITAYDQGKFTDGKRDKYTKRIVIENQPIGNTAISIETDGIGAANSLISYPLDEIMRATYTMTQYTVSNFTVRGRDLDSQTLYLLLAPWSRIGRTFYLSNTREPHQAIFLRGAIDGGTYTWDGKDWTLDLNVIVIPPHFGV